MRKNYISLLVLLCFMQNPVKAITIIVSSSLGSNLPGCTTCQTITLAINSASNGDVIQIEPGTYSEEIIIDKSLTLQGAFPLLSGNNAGRGTGESIIRASTTDLVNGILVDIQSNNVIIEGLTLDGNMGLVQGMRINGFSNITIRNNIIQNLSTSNNTVGDPQLAGIYTTGPSQGHIFQNNLIQTITEPAKAITISVISPAIPNPETLYLGAGIYLDNSEAQISNNTIQLVSTGIRVDNLSSDFNDILISANNINPVLEGISLRNLSSLNSTLDVRDNRILSLASGLVISLTLDAGISLFGPYNFTLPNSGLNLANINTPTQVRDNDIQSTYYGYNLFNIANSSNLVLERGTILEAAQGIACFNSDGSNSAPSTFGIDGVAMDNFQARLVEDLPQVITVNLGFTSFDIDLDDLIVDNLDFHAGIYLIAQGSGFNLTVEVENCSIAGTESHLSNNAGIYATAAVNNQISLVVDSTQIIDNDNRGIHLNRIQNAIFRHCTITGNGFQGYDDPNVAGVFEDGLGIILRNFSTDVSFENCFIHSNVGSAKVNVRLQNSSTAIFRECSMLTAVNQIENDGGQIDASQCWWGNAGIPGGFLGSNAANIDFTPWFNTGNDIDGGRPGFQGDYSYLNVGNTGIQIQSLGRVQEAHDVLSDGGTVNVRNATYNENFTVSKNLTLTSNLNNTTISDITMNQVGIVMQLARDFRMSGLLTLNGGVIQTNTNLLWIDNDAVGAIIQNAVSWVNGRLERNLIAGNFYAFPVGDASDMERVEIRLDNTSGSPQVEMEFIPQNPLVPFIVNPITEDLITYNTLFSDGYWEAQLTSGFNDSFDLIAYPSFVNSEPTVIYRSNSLNSLVPPENVFVDGTPRTVTNATARDDMDGNDFSAKSIFFAIGVPDVALPFALWAFDAQREDSGVLTSWELRGESNLQSLILERSPGNSGFEEIKEIALVDGQGKYTYFDSEVQFIGEQRLYYRLKMKDLQGRIQYSLIEEVNLTATVLISLYPNPVSDFLTIESDGGALSHLEIHNAQGIRVLDQEIKDARSKVDTRGFPAGIYWLRVRDRHQIVLKKIIIQH